MNPVLFFIGFAHQMRRPLAYLAVLAAFSGPSQAFELRFSAQDGSTELRQSLEAASLLVPLAKQATPAPQDVLSAAQADYGRIIGALYDSGHFAPVINITLDGRESAGISPITPPRGIATVRIRVDPGPLFRFGKVQLTPVPNTTELPVEFQRGQVAKTGTIRKAVEAGVDAWRGAGYAKAEIAAQQLQATHPPAVLDAEITLAPGPRLTIGDLVISGNTAVHTSRIRDIAGLPTGTVFDPDEVRKAAARLRRTGAFKVAALSEADEIGAGNRLDINAQFVENKPRRFGFGLELSTNEGLGISGFWLHRNLLGGAERLRFDGEIDGIGGQTGGVDYTFGARYTRPATFNEDTDLYVETKLESLNEESYSSDSFRFEAGIIRYASDQRTYTFGLGVERARTQDAFGTRNYTIIYGTGSAEFDYRDDKLNAKSGYYALASVTPFAAVSGTESGVRSYVDLRGYKTVGPAQRLTFALRGQLGSVHGPDIATAPAGFLFYSGGSGTVRGQNYQSLGVDLGGGQTVGGRSFLGLSAELRVKARGKLSIVGFADAGYVGREAFPNGKDGNWHSGAGLGIRYDTGIGPLRVDLGVPLSGPGDNSGFELYIGIGQAF